MMDLNKTVRVLIFGLGLYALLYFQWSQYSNALILAGGRDCILNQETIIQLVSCSQKMFFLHSLCFIILLNLLRTPYTEPMIILRYGKSMFWAIVTKNLVVSFVYSIFVFVGLVKIAYTAGTNIIFDWLLEFLKLFCFCIYCCFIYHIIYLKTNNFYLSSVLLGLLNFLFMSLTLSMNYYNPKSSIYSFIGSLEFLFPFSVISGLTLFILVKRKECL